MVSVKTVPQQLYEIQQFENAIRELRERRQQIQSILDGGGTAAAFKKSRLKTEEKLRPLLQQQRDAEDQAASLRQRADEAREVLYNGSITDAKQLLAKQTELDELTRRTENIDNELLTVLEALEVQNTALAKTQAKLASAQVEDAAQHTDLQAELDSISVDEKDMLAQRKVLVREIDDDTLQVYKRKSQSRGNRPLALLNGDVCAICGVEQNLTALKQIREGQLVECSNCQRWLVAG